MFKIKNKFKIKPLAGGQKRKNYKSGNKHKKYTKQGNMALSSKFWGNFVIGLTFKIVNNFTIF